MYDRDPVAPTVSLLHAFFERSARAHPERLALEIPGNAERPRRSLGYAEFERRAEAFAERLREHVHSECVVAILLPRHTLELFVAQLGILKAGGAYTCLDASFPDAHAAFLLEDSRAVALVTDAEGAARARSARFPVATILELDASAALPPARVQRRDPPAWLSPASLAYVIYTSGTTGKPKGVLIEHAGIANLVASDVDCFRLQPGDRIAQGSSPAYDSAVEESWLAFACGATLVVLDDEVVRRGPDLVPWLCEERISVFCPPPTQLRAMGCRDPERELPDLRLLYVGGEALPRDVADRWARGRWLENGYGPTECSVTVVRTRIREGQPITIGLPVPGNQAWILDEELREVENGACGELCISGAGLARGYLNRPELTAEKFPVHPQFGRIYRTGDLVRREPDGLISYHGRIDAQVKLRGHRIELGAIESVLAAQPGVRAAACALQQTGRGALLVAFIVPAGSAEEVRIDALEGVLRETFPAYMVPSRFGVLAALPMNVGGKLDRSALPLLGVEAREAAGGEAPRDELEARIAALFRSALDLQRDPAIDEDFFLDLGGDSLAAAVAVSLLRDDARTAPLTVRDLYAARTVTALARRAREVGSEREVSRAPTGTLARVEPVSSAQLVFASSVQALFIAGELCAGAALLWLAGFELLPRGVQAVGLPAALLLAPLVAFAAWIACIPATVALLVLAKKLLIGSYRPQRVAVLSGFYLRNWIVQQVAHLVPWNLIAATEFENAALRALGARIGKRVHIHRGVVLTEGGWDLLTIGDDVMIGQDATLRLVDLVGGCLVIGPVTLGNESTLDVRAGMSAHSALGERSFLGALSNLPAGCRVPEGQCWDGVPAAPAGLAPERAAHVSKRELSPVAHALLLVLARGAYALVFPLPLIVLLVGIAWASGSAPSALGAALLDGSWSAFGLLEITLALVLSLPLGLALDALALRALGRVKLGSISRFDPAYVRLALKAEVLQAAGDWLAGTLLWPVWLRMAGMRVGRNCEISTIVDVVPESLEIGDDCFLADGIYLGGPRLHRSVVTVTLTRLAARDFLGNHAVILSGQELPEEVLVGVCTVPDTGHMHGGSSWFGHPPFELPRHKHTGFDRSLTHKPNLWRLANRLVWELARFVLPVPPLWLAFATASWAAARTSHATGALEAIGCVALAGLFAAAVLVFAVLALKWILLGRVKPGEHALWSFWCCRWDYHYELWSTWARHVLSSFEGTLFLPWYLRAMGARIGRRCVLAGGFAHVVDPDMLHIEDDVTVHALFQAHSFEDRVLKIDRITIRSGADVGSGAVLFYGAEIGEGAVVAPHSVVMKHERLLPGRVYEGCPTVLSQGQAPATIHAAREMRSLAEAGTTQPA